LRRRPAVTVEASDQLVQLLDAFLDHGVIIRLIGQGPGDLASVGG